MDSPEHTIAGVFRRREQAEAVLTEMTSQGIAAPDHCELVGPGRGLTPGTAAVESRRTRRSLWRWHAGLGFAGLVGGFVVAALARALNPAWFAIGDALVFAVAGLFGATAGMLVAGAISLRPDQGDLFSRLRDHTRRGDWAVLVCTRSADEHARARDFLGREADRALSSL